MLPGTGSRAGHAAVAPGGAVLASAREPFDWPKPNLAIRRSRRVRSADDGSRLLPAPHRAPAGRGAGRFADRPDPRSPSVRQDNSCPVHLCAELPHLGWPAADFGWPALGLGSSRANTATTPTSVSTTPSHERVREPIPSVSLRICRSASSWTRYSMSRRCSKPSRWTWTAGGCPAASYSPVPPMYSSSRAYRNLWPDASRSFGYIRCPSMSLRRGPPLLIPVPMLDS